MTVCPWETFSKSLQFDLGHGATIGISLNSITRAEDDVYHLEEYTEYGKGGIPRQHVAKSRRWL